MRSPVSSRNRRTSGSFWCISQYLRITFPRGWVRLILNAVSCVLYWHMKIVQPGEFDELKESARVVNGIRYPELHFILVACILVASLYLWDIPWSFLCICIHSYSMRLLDCYRRWNFPETWRRLSGGKLSGQSGRSWLAISDRGEIRIWRLWQRGVRSTRRQFEGLPQIRFRTDRRKSTHIDGDAYRKSMIDLSKNVLWVDLFVCRNYRTWLDHSTSIGHAPGWYFMRFLSTILDILCVRSHPENLADLWSDIISWR